MPSCAAPEIAAPTRIGLIARNATGFLADAQHSAVLRRAAIAPGRGGANPVADRTGAYFPARIVRHGLWRCDGRPSVLEMACDLGVALCGPTRGGCSGRYGQ